MNKNYKAEFTKRQYMLSRDYEIYYYSDTQFQNVESHIHKYYEFYFFVEGNVSIQIREKVQKLQPGDVVILPPGLPHRAIIHDRNGTYSRFVFWISMEYYQKLRGMSEDYYYIVQRASEQKEHIYHNTAVEFSGIQSKILRLIEEIHGEKYGKDAQMFIGICDLLLHLNRMAYVQNNPQKRSEERNLYRKILEYIDGRLEQELSLEHLAGRFYVSKYHIAHIFKENTGISIHQYIMKKRLAACRDAILSNISISRAYLMFGFKDYSSFYRAFKKEFGISPKEYRDRKIQIELAEEKRQKKTGAE